MYLTLVSVFFLTLKAVHAGANVTLPGCQLVPPAQITLSHVKTAYTNFSGAPLGLEYALKGNFAFVALNYIPNASLGVLNTSTFPPGLINEIALPTAFNSNEGAASLTLSHDGTHLFVAAGVGAVIFDTSKAIAGGQDAIVGTLNGTTETQSPGSSAFLVTLSSNESYAFITQEYGFNDSGHGNIDVFKLDLGRPSSSSISGVPLGFRTLDYALTGTSLSPGGNVLFTTSTVTSYGSSSPSNETGFLNTLSVSALERDPSRTPFSNTSAGCAPVRSIVSSDGSTVWVTARESNHLLAFDAEKLASGQKSALVAAVQVGAAPVELAFVRNETRILTGDSNRWGAGETTGLSVVDVQAALEGKSGAVLGRVPTGGFPRELAVSRDGGTLLVADYSSKQIQAVEVASLP